MNDSTQAYELVAPNAREQLRRWDAGDSIWSLEMGGLGPGYEQAIQILAMEIIRDNIDNPLPDPNTPFSEWGDTTVSRIDYRKPDGTYACGGFSGAQVGAAKWLAYQFMTRGPKDLHDDERAKDRTIQVSKTFPQAPQTTPSDPAGHAGGNAADASGTDRSKR